MQKKVRITPSRLCGCVNIPASKSAMHRAVICASQCDEKVFVKPALNSDDIRRTLDCVSQLGAIVEERDGGYIIRRGRNVDTAVLNCGESGSTLRFLIPVAASLGINASFIGCGRLPERPLDEYLSILPQKGITFEGSRLPLKISGRLRGGEYSIDSSVSSQYITGLMLALAVTGEDSVIIPQAALTSRGYIDMTISIMHDFGINVISDGDNFIINGNQKFCFNGYDYNVEADWSQAAFFLTAGAIGSDIRAYGLNEKSAQGDKEITEILRRMGAKCDMSDGASVKADSLHATEIDVAQIPDLVPILAVAACFADGTTRIYNAARVRKKESDRLRAMCDNLTRMGASVSEKDDELIIEGGRGLHGASLSGYNDHRIVMALSVAAAFADGETVIDDAQSIAKSYPTFFEDYNKIGGKANVFNVGE